MIDVYVKLMNVVPTQAEMDLKLPQAPLSLVGAAPPSRLGRDGPRRISQASAVARAEPEKPRSRDHQQVGRVARRPVNRRSVTTSPGASRFMRDRKCRPDLMHRAQSGHWRFSA